MDLNEYHRYFSKLPAQKIKRRAYAKKHRQTHKIFRDPISRREKRILLKKKCISFLGKTCKNCNLKSNIIDLYDIYHISLSKSIVDKMVNNLRKWDIIESELENCILLCKNCGIILKDKQNSFEQPILVI